MKFVVEKLKLKTMHHDGYADYIKVDDDFDYDDDHDYYDYYHYHSEQEDIKGT